MEALKEKFTKYPVASRASFGIILAGIEQLLALQFACPCDGLWRNRELTAAVFIIPTIIILALMLIIEGFAVRGVLESILTFFSVTTPIIIWLMLMLLDGRFFTCAMTDWEGRYVELDGADPQRWCEPNNSSLTCLDDDDLEPPLGCMLKTQELFVTSQRIGLALLFYLFCVLIILSVIGLTKPKAGGTWCGCCFVVGGNTNAHRTDYGPSQNEEEVMLQLSNAMGPGTHRWSPDPGRIDVTKDDSCQKDSNQNEVSPCLSENTSTPGTQKETV